MWNQSQPSAFSTAWRQAMPPVDGEVLAPHHEAGDLVAQDHVLQQAGRLVQARLDPLDVDQRA